MESLTSSAVPDDCRLVLGTAQLGLPYGIANRTGQPDEVTAFEIIREAWDNGIREFDTAQAYGESESVLGKALSDLGISREARVITKIDLEVDHLDVSAMSKSLDQSLERLGVHPLFGIMLHNEETLHLWEKGLAEILHGFVSSGRTENVGISVYSPDKAVQALNTEGIDIVQLPTNILDRRFEDAGVFRLADEIGKIVYVRSVFLQGLLLMQPEEVPPEMAFARSVLEELKSLSDSLELNRIEIALGYVRSEMPNTRVIFGAETSSHVRESVNAWKRRTPESLCERARSFFSSVSEQVLNPLLWPESEAISISPLRLESIEKERAKRLSPRAMEPNAIEDGFKQCIRRYTVEPARTKLFAAYEFAKQIEYNHPGFSNASYLAHPVRVACLAMQLAPLVDTDTLVIALLHNVLEVSNLKFGDLKKRFNGRVANAIKLLTVDRSRQENQTYKSLYYKNLNASFSGVRIVKVLDKLDNLFLLYLNADGKKREWYLKEIEDYIIPMVDGELGDLSEYYRRLVENCRRIGHLDGSKITNAKLFQPDIFSRSYPEYTSVTEDTFDAVTALLKTHYGFDSGTIKEVEQFKGNEITSSNFRVETASECLFVKKNTFHSDVSVLNKVFELVNWLYEKNLPFPKVIPCHSGSLAAEEGGAFWSVSKFIQGRYFSGGSIEEIEQVGREIGRLHSVLRSVPSDLLPQREIVPFPVDANVMLDELSAKRDEWPDIFGEEVAFILEISWDLLLSTYELINSEREAILEPEMQVCHIDLHPHNILVGNNNVITFVDPDSLVRANPCMAVSFAICKLMRQHSVEIRSPDNLQEIPDHAKKLFCSIREMFDLVDENMSNLCVFAIAEMFRRLLIILKLNLLKGNRSLNHIIPIHFATLREAKVLFG